MFRVWVRVSMWDRVRVTVKVITYLLRYLHDRRLLPLWSAPVFHPVHTP